MKVVKTTSAQGHILCHDITKIVPGEIKDAVFRRGHVVTAEDIPVLLALGKEELYIWENSPGFVHEDDAAMVLYGILAGANMSPTPVKEGKIDIVAEIDGLLAVDVSSLKKLNGLGEIMAATRHGLFPVRKGEKLAGARIIPLSISKAKLDDATEISRVPILELLPFLPLRTGIITTGNEVYKGLITDKFTPVLIDKIMEFGGIVTEHEILPDNHAQITETILAMKSRGAEIILCSGGMSVDPDDRTPLAIKNAADTVVSYGAPTLPGAMFMLAYSGSVPIMGLPGCVMYSKRTIFDIILPRIMAGLTIGAADIQALGHGGMCLNCDVCIYPNCAFGK